MITIKPTRSDMISEMSYDNGKMTITFNKGGQYTFKNVPKEQFDRLLGSESMGKHFHAHIKGKFENEKC